MKKLVITLVIVFLGLILFFSLYNKKENDDNKEPTESKQDNTPPASTLIDQDRVIGKRRKQEERRANEIQLGIQQANVPIDFWGKIVDQNSKPLKGVVIRYRVGKPRDIWDSNTAVREITTDQNGSFHINDKGDGFSFEAFEKKGYKIAQGQRSTYTYSDSSERYVPDKNNPKIFTLIKKDEIQDLISFSKQLLLDWDGAPVYYDLKSGKLGESGEIEITAFRGEVKGEGRQARYDWLFKVEVPNGGVIQTKREESSFAPKEGYKSHWEYGFSSSDPEWGHRKKGQTFLFFKLQNGNYGRLEIDFSSELGSRISGRINSYLNPSGGRILETSS